MKKMLKTLALVLVCWFPALTVTAAYAAPVTGSH